MSWKLLASFAVMTFFLNLMPGPAVMQVVGQAMTNGWARAQAGIVGILAGNLLYCAVSALGLSAILFASPQLFAVVKYAGTAYLAWLAVKILFGRRGAAEIAAGQREPARRLFARGALLALSNPKSMLFFCAILPTFAGGTQHVTHAIALLGATAILIEYPVLLGYSMVASFASRLTDRPGFTRTVSYISGLMLLSAAIFVARMSI
ncbi:LysE family translocator [Burkholderia alba]|uniref:LysE family translocator n=1 Tax=Burkholderia alba TaxID=2683677 RepID=UPI002B05C8F9|nr:LysE family translocator [Burkholderia alba]